MSPAARPSTATGSRTWSASALSDPRRRCYPAPRRITSDFGGTPMSWMSLKDYPKRESRNCLLAPTTARIHENVAHSAYLATIVQDMGVLRPALVKDGKNTVCGLLLACCFGASFLSCI